MASFNCVRHDICRHSYVVKRGLVIGFCSQPHYCNWPYYPTARFSSSLLWQGRWKPGCQIVGSVTIVSLLNRFQTCQGPRCANLHQWWRLAQSPSSDCDQRQIMNHIVSKCPLTQFEGGTESTPWSRWWRNHMTGIYSNCSAREMNLICLFRPLFGESVKLVHSGSN